MASSARFSAAAAAFALACTGLAVAAPASAQPPDAGTVQATVQVVVPVAVSEGVKPRRQRATVVRVLDGDTLRVKVLPSRKRMLVQVLGANAAEWSGPRKACGRAEAKRSMQRMVPRGSTVRLVLDPIQKRRDPWDRNTRYVEKANGVDVGLRQIVRGWSRYLHMDRGFTRGRVYWNAKEKAKRAGRGVWGQPSTRCALEAIR